MRRIGLVALALGMSGLLAGCSLLVFVSAAFTMAVAAWLIELCRYRRHTSAFLNLGEPESALRLLADGLNRCADRALADGRPIWLRVAVAPGVFDAASRCRLTLDRRGEPLLERGGSRAVQIAEPRRWIADHPVPFALPPGGVCTITFLPVGRRVRVGTGVPAARWPVAVWFTLFALALASCFYGFQVLGAAAAGTAAAWAVCRRQM